jgi:hypothetical protein
VLPSSRRRTFDSAAQTASAGASTR